MESSERGALGLVRLVAGCLIVIGLLDVGLYLTQFFASRNHPTLSILRIVLESIPILIGIIIFIKAKAIAEWLSDLIQ